MENATETANAKNQSASKYFQYLNINLVKCITKVNKSHTQNVLYFF